MVQGYLATQAFRALSEPADVVYVHSHSAGRVVLSLDKNLPVIVSLDGTVHAESRMTVGRTPFPDQTAVRLEQAIFDRANLIVALSDWARASVINDYGIPEEKTRTIRNGVDPIPSVTGQAGWTPRSELPIIGFVGNGLKRKGGDLLLESHQRYLSNQSHLVMVTKDTLRTEELKNVTILGPMPRAQLLSSVLPRFTVFAHPARKDWSPYSVIEALAAGKPIVATAIGSLPEMVIDGVNGYLVQSPTPASLADALRSVLEDEGLAARMGHASQALFEQRYRADHNYPELIRTIRSHRRTSENGHE